MEQDTRQEIRDDGDLRKYRIEIPNMADDDLGVYEFRLYGHYKRVCGANGGVCFENVRTTAERCKMSVGQVVESRNWLEENHWIVTTENPRTRGLSVVIMDRWEENFLRYSHVHQVNDGHAQACSPGERKNKPYKNQPIVKKDNSFSSIPDFPGSRFISGKYAREIKR